MITLGPYFRPLFSIGRRKLILWNGKCQQNVRWLGNFWWQLLYRRRLFVPFFFFKAKHRIYHEKKDQNSTEEDFNRHTILSFHVYSNSFQKKIQKFFQFVGWKLKCLYQFYKYFFKKLKSQFCPKICGSPSTHQF